ncbi:MAG: ABC transporter substrate-binding protein [Pseudomonadota bacterium]
MAVFWILALSVIISGGPAHSREIVDMSGRSVSVPDTITRVYGASPPVTCMIYAMDPGLIAGLNSPITRPEGQFMSAEVKNLPVIGGWFGQGRTPNQETLLQIKPDVMIVWMWVSPGKDKIEETAKQLGVPLVYIRIDHLSDYTAAFRFLGTLLNRETRGRMLSEYTEQALKSVETVVSGIPNEKKKSIYYAEGMDGLSTECDQSFHTELIPLAGGKNIHRCAPKDIYGMEKISIEQVMLYDPEVILAQEKTFAENVFNDPRWQSIRAVRARHVLRIPRVPFNWFDRPPSFMRILGVQWLTHCLYPDLFSLDVPSETKKFYKLFLGVDMDGKSLSGVLE